MGQGDVNVCLIQVSCPLQKVVVLWLTFCCLFFPDIFAFVIRASQNMNGVLESE